MDYKFCSKFIFLPTIRLLNDTAANGIGLEMMLLTERLDSIHPLRRQRELCPILGSFGGAARPLS
jgi:hypothetical protein